MKRRGREICKSFELNQTCPSSKTTAPAALPITPPDLYDRPAKNAQDASVNQQEGITDGRSLGRDIDASLSSIYSSNPSYLSSLVRSPSICQRSSTRKRQAMEKIRGKYKQFN